MAGPRRLRASTAAAAATLALVLGLAGCGSGDGSGGGGDPYGTPAPPAATTPESADDAPASTTAAPRTASVVIADMAFSPQAQRVRVGGTVAWTNRDSTPHTVTGEDGGPASPELAAGDTYRWTPTKPGTYTYRCTIHPSMTATVTVVR